MTKIKYELNSAIDEYIDNLALKSSLNDLLSKSLAKEDAKEFGNLLNFRKHRVDD